MGLFDFLKKPQKDTPAAENTYKRTYENPYESGQSSVFKGDLAFIHENSTPKRTESSRAVATNAVPPPVKTDSPDSVVFMSFDMTIKDFWICPECRTNNDKHSNGCIVCGFRK